MAENKVVKKIVVLGAGYAGLRAVLDLAESCQRGALKAELTLIDRSPCHQIITWLHLTATEALPANCAYLPLEQLIPTDVVTVMQADVEAINPNAHTVGTSSGKVNFDRLVVTKPTLEILLMWRANGGMRRSGKTS